MVFVACGLNHKTAPVEIREKIALPPSLHHSLLESLMELHGMHEALVLSTCNRTEIYCETDDPQSIPLWLAQEHHIDPSILLPHLYLHTADEGMRHVLRVSTGLDSMMLGEPQILGQIKKAWQNACDWGSANTRLRPLFEHIFRASKRIRNRSGIGNNPISIAYAAVQLISNKFPQLENSRIFLIGSGETATLIARYLHKQGARDFMVASRTRENAEYLAGILEGEALDITDIPVNLSKADIIITATTCPLPFINSNMVTHALEIRHQQPLFLLDLAVPRDIEPQVGQLDHVCLYNIDDLQNMTQKGMEKRREAALKAEALVEEELENYGRLHRERKARDLICDYREHMQKLAHHELERALQKLSAGYDQKTVLTEFSSRIVQKLTHLPTSGLREVAKEDHESLLQLAQHLFNTSRSRHTDEKIT